MERRTGEEVEVVHDVEQPCSDESAEHGCEHDAGCRASRCSLAGHRAGEERAAHDYPRNHEQRCPCDERQTECVWAVGDGHRRSASRLRLRTPHFPRAKPATPAPQALPTIAVSMTTVTHATDQQIEAFLSHLRAERGFSVNTIAAYRSDLAQLQEALVGNERDVRWADVSQRDVEDVHLSFGERGYAGTSLARKIAAARSFFRFPDRGRRDRHEPCRAAADAQAVPHPPRRTHRARYRAVAAGRVGASGTGRRAGQGDAGS